MKDEVPNLRLRVPVYRLPSTVYRLPGTRHRLCPQPPTFFHYPSSSFIGVPPRSTKGIGRPSGEMFSFL
jgi:hypothetical protein